MLQILTLKSFTTHKQVLKFLKKFCGNETFNFVQLSFLNTNWLRNLSSPSVFNRMTISIVRHAPFMEHALRNMGPIE